MSSIIEYENKDLRIFQYCGVSLAVPSYSLVYKQFLYIIPFKQDIMHMMGRNKGMPMISLWVQHASYSRNESLAVILGF